MDWLWDLGKEYGLFVMLVGYVLWDTRGREIRYLAIIQTLSEEVKDRLVKIETKVGINHNTKK